MVLGCGGRAPQPRRRAPGPAPSGLPRQLTRFVGRDRELAEVREALAAHPLVTLTGPGGGGKTRLALLAAGTAPDAYPHGTWFVDLAPLADAALVPQAALAALGVRELPGRSHLATLTEHLRFRELLLVLDNCEHVVDACAEVVDRLLGACPGLRVLATSREALGIDGELVYRVPPLAVPDPRQPPAVERLAQVDAVRLFVDRARLVRPGFALTAENAADVAAVCRRLDGLPLALELAAAQVRALQPGQLLARLEDRFRVLAGGRRSVLPRQQTLRATVDWSHDLLTGSERTLFARLSVFAGGWTLEAAETVGADDEHQAPADERAAGATGVAARPSPSALRPGDVLDRLTRLADKSLVIVDEAPGDEARYRLLETLRQYAGEKLAAAGEAEAVRGRHRDHFLALAERAAPLLVGRDQAAWFDRLEAEYDNLRAALEWGQADPDGAAAQLRLAGALGRYWAVRGYASEGCAWLARALDRAGAPHVPHPPAARVAALAAAGRLEGRMANARRARALLEEGVALARASGDRQLLARVLEPLSPVLWYFEDGAARRAHLEETLATARATRSARLLANAHLHLGWAAFERGDREEARRLVGHGLATARAAGDETHQGYGNVYLGRMAVAWGDHGAARSHLQEGLAAAAALGDRHCLALGQVSLGDLASVQGAHAEALSRYRQGLEEAREAGYTRLIAEALLACAAAGAAQGRAEHAARLFSAAEAVVATLEGPRPWGMGPSWASRYGAAVGAARAALGGPAFAALRQAGEALPLEQAIREALDWRGDAARPDPLPPLARAAAPPRRPDGLSPREVEVLALVAAGRSNQEIAATLVLSVRTVERHLARVYDRLGLSGKSARAAAATFAAGRGLAAPPVSTATLPTPAGH